jgi:N-acetylglucosaminyl-diphospho-decaprenol L-rhamnosyltransferase
VQAHSSNTCPDVSVIVIGHDVRDEVLAALRSVDEYCGDMAIEMIVVDNGSTDGTAGAVGEAFPEARVVRLARNELGAARNHGLRIARGRYRMFLDSDARLTAGALEELTRFLDAHPKVGLVGPRLVYPDGSPQYAARRYPPLLLPLLRRPPLGRFFERGRVVRRYDDGQRSRHPREVEYLITACVLFSAEAQLATGQMDPAVPFWEDADWCLSMRAAGYRIAYDPAATAIHSYRRITAQHPFSTDAVRHLVGFLRLRMKWRGGRARLRAQARAIDATDGALD